MLTNDQLSLWDRENFFHPSTHLAQHARGESHNRIIKTASGCYIEDRDGNHFLDAFAGLYCVNVGYGRQEIADAISDNQTYIPKREGEMETTWSNIDKINQVIGWKPEVDVLEWIKC